METALSSNIRNNKINLEGRTTPSAPFEHVKGLDGPCFRRGETALLNRSVALLGLSLGNPFYTQENISELLAAVAPRVQSIQIFITDPIAHHTFQALGMSEIKAKQKAHTDGNNRRNRLSRALNDPRILHRAVDVHLLDWRNEVLSNGDYAAHYHGLRALYQHNPAFREAMREATRGVVSSRVVSPLKLETIEAAVDIGLPFLLKELAFILASPRIFKTPSVTYIYHRRWPILERLLNGDFGPVAGDNVAFAVFSRAGQ